MKYIDLKQQQQERVNNFEGLFFAFSDKQMSEGLARYGISEEEATEKVSSLGMGGFILKEKRSEFYALLEQFEVELAALKQDHERLLEALSYELANHEYCITGDLEPALMALDLQPDDVPKDVLEKAIEQQQGGW